MKALNNMTFIYNATTQFNVAISRIENADTYESARRRANYAIGFVECLMIYLNTMICKENNDFTADFGQTLDIMMHTIYQALADKARATEQDSEEVLKILKKRDEYRS